jgi:uncharacterized repeat protein (TIGR03803 family)
LTTLFRFSILTASFVLAHAQAPTFKTIYSFKSGNDGANPFAGVVQDATGSLYGTTNFGGPSNLGTVFKLSPPTTSNGNWAETTLTTFSGLNGGEPHDELVIDQLGSLYATTEQGGTVGCGTAFRMTPPAVSSPNWILTTLHNFQGNFSGAPFDGCAPTARLLPTENAFYGTTFSGGLIPKVSDGTVFKLDLSGASPVESAIYSFSGYPSDGSVPASALVRGQNGVLYGTTFAGGTFDCNGFEDGCGTVFQLIPPVLPGADWTESVLHSFGAGTDGAYPIGALAIDHTGALYGATSDGGTAGVGTIFKLEPPSSPGETWTETVLHSFQSSDGINPNGDVLLLGDTLYGVTLSGGGSLNCQSLGCGVVYQLTAPTSPNEDWTLAVLHSFDDGPDGRYPNGRLLIRNGVIYGTTSGLNSTSSSGTVFEITR